MTAAWNTRLWRRCCAEARFPLATPTGPALVEMMTGPARCAALTFEPGLLDRIWTDTGTAPGGLALLALALAELYEGRVVADGALTRDVYDVFGRVRQAIGQRADRTLAELPPDVRELPPVFLKLIEVNEAGVATRRRNSRDDLVVAFETRQRP